MGILRGEVGRLAMIQQWLFLHVVMTKSWPKRTPRTRQLSRDQLFYQQRRSTQQLARSRECSSRSSLRIQILVPRLPRMSKSQVSGMLDFPKLEVERLAPKDVIFKHLRTYVWIGEVLTSLR